MPGVDAAPSASSSSPVVEVPPTATSTSRAPPKGGEAARETIARLEDDPSLAPRIDALRAHFGEAKGPFFVQRATLTRGRALLLVTLADDAKPMAIAVAEDGHTLWTRERPTGGIFPPAQHLAIAPHPEEGAVLFAFVPTVYTIAARMWTDDGGPFADIQIMPADTCEALSAAYWPGHGWLVVAARFGGARAQLLRESGVIGWSKEGIEVGAAWRAPAPVTVVIDGPESAVLVQYASRGVAGIDHIVAARIDADGKAFWAAPVDLGAVPHVPAGAERVSARLADDAVLVDLPRGLALNAATRTVGVDAAGNVH